MAQAIQFGLILDTNEPVDNRTVVADETARLALASGVVYEGLVVYQEDNNTIYVLTDDSDPSDSDNWAEVGGESNTPNDATITITAGDGLSGGGDFTTDQSSAETITLNVDEGIGLNQHPKITASSGLTAHDWLRVSSSGMYGQSTAEAQGILVTKEAIEEALEIMNSGDAQEFYNAQGDFVAVSGISDNNFTNVLRNKLDNIPNLPTGDGNTQDRILRTTGTNGNESYSWESLPAEYVLPAATATTLGGVIVPNTSDLSVNNSGDLSLKNLSASKITSGVFDVARLSSDTPTNGQVLEFDGTNAVWGDGSTYTLPVASSSTLGGIKITSDFDIDSNDRLVINQVGASKITGVINYQRLSSDTPTNTQVLTFNGTSAVWDTPSSVVRRTIELNDVDQADRANINFDTVFSITDESANDRLTIGIEDATSTSSGLLTSVAQSIGGVKTFVDNITANGNLTVAGNTTVSGNLTTGAIAALNGNITLGNESSDTIDVGSGDVTLSNIPEGTPVTGGYLALDNENKLIKYTPETDQTILNVAGFTSDNNAFSASGDDVDFTTVFNLNEESDGTITVDIQDANASQKGLLTNLGQTIAGTKTFTSPIVTKGQQIEGTLLFNHDDNNQDGKIEWDFDGSNNAGEIDFKQDNLGNGEVDIKLYDASDASISSVMNIQKDAVTISADSIVFDGLEGGGSGKFLAINGSGHISAATPAGGGGGGGSSFYQTIQNNGTDQTQRAKINFSSDFLIADSASNDRTTITLADTAVRDALVALTSISDANKTTIKTNLGIDDGGDTVSVDTTLADLLSVSDGVISAKDLGVDAVYGWDDSAGKATFLSGSDVRLAIGAPGLGSTNTFTTTNTFNDGLVIPTHTANPSITTEGAVYFNTTSNQLRAYNGSSWSTINASDVTLKAYGWGTLVSGDLSVEGTSADTTEGEVFYSSSNGRFIIPHGSTNVLDEEIFDQLVEGSVIGIYRKVGGSDTNTGNRIGYYKIESTSSTASTITINIDDSTTVEPYLIPVEGVTAGDILSDLVEGSDEFVFYATPAITNEDIDSFDETSDYTFTGSVVFDRASGKQKLEIHDGYTLIGDGDGVVKNVVESTHIQDTGSKTHTSYHLISETDDLTIQKTGETDNTIQISDTAYRRLSIHETATAEDASFDLDYGAWAGAYEWSVPSTIDLTNETTGDTRAWIGNYPETVDTYTVSAFIDDDLQGMFTDGTLGVIRNGGVNNDEVVFAATDSGDIQLYAPGANAADFRTYSGRTDSSIISQFAFYGHNQGSDNNVDTSTFVPYGSIQGWIESNDSTEDGSIRFFAADAGSLDEKLRVDHDRVKMWDKLTLDFQSTDPSNAEGAMFYNSDSDTYRINEGGNGWEDIATREFVNTGFIEHATYISVRSTQQDVNPPTFEYTFDADGNVLGSHGIGTFWYRAATYQGKDAYELVFSGGESPNANGAHYIQVVRGTDSEEGYYKVIGYPEFSNEGNTNDFVAIERTPVAGIDVLDLGTDDDEYPSDDAEFQINYNISDAVTSYTVFNDNYNGLVPHPGADAGFLQDDGTWVDLLGGTNTWDDTQTFGGAIGAIISTDGNQPRLDFVSDNDGSNNAEVTELGDIQFYLGSTNVGSRRGIIRMGWDNTGTQSDFEVFLHDGTNLYSGLTLDEDGLKLDTGSSIDGDDFTKLADLPALPTGDGTTQKSVLQTTGAAGSEAYTWVDEAEGGNITVTSSSVSDGTNTFDKYTDANAVSATIGKTDITDADKTTYKTNLGITDVTVTSTSVSDGTNTFDKYTDANAVSATLGKTDITDANKTTYRSNLGAGEPIVWNDGSNDQTITSIVAGTNITLSESSGALTVTSSGGGDSITEYSTTDAYSVGDIIVYNSQIYQCDTALSAATAWAANTSYDTGDNVTNDGKRYRSISGADSGATFLSSNWLEVTPGTESQAYWDVLSINNAAGSETYLLVNSTGTAPSAGGTDAIAIGESSDAASTNSIAIGNSADITSGSNGIAIGTDAILQTAALTTTDNHFAANALAGAGRSIAIGQNALAGGGAAIAIGGASASTGATTAWGNDAVAIGEGATSRANGAISIGRDADAYTTDSVAIGAGAVAEHTNSMAIGSGATARAANVATIGDTDHLVELGRQTTSDDNDLAVATKLYVDDHGLHIVDGDDTEIVTSVPVDSDDHLVFPRDAHLSSYTEPDDQIDTYIRNGTNLIVATFQGDHASLTFGEYAGQSTGVMQLTNGSTTVEIDLDNTATGTYDAGDDFTEWSFTESQWRNIVGSAGISVHTVTGIEISSEDLEVVSTASIVTDLNDVVGARTYGDYVTGCRYTGTSGVDGSDSYTTIRPTWDDDTDYFRFFVSGGEEIRDAASSGNVLAERKY